MSEPQTDPHCLQRGRVHCPEADLAGTRARTGRVAAVELEGRPAVPCGGTGAVHPGCRARRECSTAAHGGMVPCTGVQADQGCPPATIATGFADVDGTRPTRCSERDSTTMRSARLAVMRPRIACRWSIRTLPRPPHRGRGRQSAADPHRRRFIDTPLGAPGSSSNSGGSTHSKAQRTRPTALAEHAGIIAEDLVPGRPPRQPHTRRSPRREPPVRRQ